MSKALNKEEQNYCVTRKELLAVVSALKNFHSYLNGQEVLLRTDNAAVSWLKNLKMPSGQIARWLQEIGNYNLIITHRPGRQHGNADTLSRKPCKACSRQQDKHTELEAKDKEESFINMDNAQLCQTRAITRSQGTSNTKYPVQKQLILKGWELSEIKKSRVK
jgi:hypothetical protein